MIHESLAGIAHPIEDFQVWDSNPRKGDIEAIKASLERYGQRQPIIYRTEVVNDVEFKTVYAGNHRLQAALKLGWDEIAAVNADDLSFEEVQSFAMADNRTSDLAEYDKEAMAELIAELNQTDQSILEDMRFSGAEIDQIVSGMPYPSDGIDFDKEWEGMPEFNVEDQTPKNSLIINFQEEPDFAELSELLNQKITERTKSVWWPPKPREKLDDKRY